MLEVIAVLFVTLYEVNHVLGGDSSIFLGGVVFAVIRGAHPVSRTVTHAFGDRRLEVV